MLANGRPGNDGVGDLAPTLVAMAIIGLREMFKQEKEVMML